MSKQNLIGESSSFLEVLDQVSLYAPLNRPVLIIGERGTGKELVAARLHYLSERWDKQYITLNCASLNENLIESELFGHSAGAFTGATHSRKGRFELADQGSLFLDELATLPMMAQEKLLRAIEYGEFERLGSNQVIKTDARLICATNLDLPTQAKLGKFRSDLLDRLSFAVITLPPLRARKEDILILADYFAQKMAQELRIDGRISFSKHCEQQLLDYTWPGNVRELRNVIQRALVQSPQDEIQAIKIDPFESPWRPQKSNEMPHTDTDKNFTAQVQNLEKQLLEQALHQHNFHQARSAQSLGLTYDQLRGLMKKHQLLPSKQR
ncbi:phage shock protein operon transcriptional activator [Alginatibacterium sediminis]|uniref:Phage shock protein operon transcriptional activator n=1 Tax=Alginatibacterium sediminis TaxID=2164068 RepID=A0A420EGK8_9ALTE|nr:phage shock protein operon transcriptional activator [Alginatibacterium sediminis]RKF19818.1 phage shock protein operon transcriptional activator [Alginatibacterium sediminis]